MKVLLTVPPFVEEGLEMACKESIGVCYLAAVLRARGFHVDILDADLLKLSPSGAVDRICAGGYDLIGFSSLEGTIESTEVIVECLRAKGVTAHIVLGGYFPTLTTEETLQRLKGIDTVIRGEGEYALLKLTQHLSEGRDWHELGSVAYRRNGEVVLNDNARAFPIDDLPFPVRDLLPEVLRRGGVCGVVGSRGCFGACSFCCVHSLHKTCDLPSWRGRAVSSIVEEVRVLVRQWGVDSISFYDSNFIGPGRAGVARTYEIAQEMMNRVPGVRFAISSRPDQVEEDLFRFLKRAGMSEVFIGIESMSQDSLDLYEKRVTVEQNRRAVEILEGLEINYRPGFIFYEPFMTLDQVRENIDFLRVLLDSRFCNKFHFFKALRVYRGAPIEALLQKRGVLARNGWHNAYRWQDPSVAEFIRLSGRIGAKMLPLMERVRFLDPDARKRFDRLIGRWSLDVHEAVLNVVRSGGGNSTAELIELSLKAEKELQRIERTLSFMCN